MNIWKDVKAKTILLNTFQPIFLWKGAAAGEKTKPGAGTCQKRTGSATLVKYYKRLVPLELLNLYSSSTLVHFPSFFYLLDPDLQLSMRIRILWKYRKKPYTSHLRRSCWSWAAPPLSHETCSMRREETGWWRWLNRRYRCRSWSLQMNYIDKSYPFYISGLWIRIYCLGIRMRIQQFFLNADPDPGLGTAEPNVKETNHEDCS